MNFLEQLVAEWYQYNGYFVRTNLKFGRNERGRGGHAGEMDVVAYQPKTEEFIHIEASTDSLPRLERKKKFETQFTGARKYYMEAFPFIKLDIEPQQIALVGFNRTRSLRAENWKSSAPSGSPWGDIKIDVIHIPEFFEQINTELSSKDPQNDAIPENYPLLRAIQYSVFFR